MSSAAWNLPKEGNPQQRFESEKIFGEGEDGKFTQSWYPICLSTEVEKGAVKGCEFLGGRIVVFRGEDGVAQVLSAFCPHMGADLCTGTVMKNTLRCAFHHWKYDGDGKCVETAIGDPPPPSARLYKFVSQEKFGLVWAFNGDKPHYDLPDFPVPESELVIRTVAIPGENPVDPWVQCANTPDIQHIKALHNIKFTQEDPEDIVWTDSSLRYSFAGIHTDGSHVHNVVGINGTSLYYQVTDYAGKWFGFMDAMGLPRPGAATNYMILAARKDFGTAEEVETYLDFIFQLEVGVVSEDLHVMQSMKFRPGTLTKSDRTLGRFFDYMRKYPRAHPSQPFI